MLDPEEAAKVAIANAPILEGAVFAVVEASTGSNLQAVENTAMEARMLDKTEH